MSRLRLSLLLILPALGLLIRSSLVVVDETEFVLVTEFGRTVRVLGGPGGQAGLSWKLPWQSTLAVDRRLHVLDPPPREVLTADKKNLEVTSYVVWRVASPETFLRASGSIEAAEARLNERVVSVLSDVVGRKPFAGLASVDPAVWALDTVGQDAVGRVRQALLDESGIEVVDIRLRRFNHPTEVRPAIFDLIRAERKQAASRLRSEGEAAYQTRVSEANRERDTVLAKAEAEALRIAGQAEAEAARISGEAYRKDPAFAEFLRTLDAYKAILDDRTTIVLSTGSPLLRMLTAGPASELLSPPPPGASK